MKYVKPFALPIGLWCWKHYRSFWGLKGDKCPACREPSP